MSNCKFAQWWPQRWPQAWRSAAALAAPLLLAALGCDVRREHVVAQGMRFVDAAVLPSAAAPGSSSAHAPSSAVTNDASRDAALDAAFDAALRDAGGRDAAPPDAALGDAGPSCGKAGALALYERKIAPLFADDRPSTCSQCHLPGVDLQLFARGTPCETFACLSDQGLVNPEQPKDSLILSWIGRAEPDSELITAETIAEEHAAFSQWLEYTVACGTCRDAECPATGPVTCEAPNVQDDDVDLEALDPGGCSSPALEAVFEQAVYAQRGRCSPCHYVGSEDEAAPAWIEVSFDCDEASLRTLNNVLRLGYLNLSESDQSLLLLKPLAEAEGGLPHGGGDKFGNAEDPGYVSMKYFIDRYAACQPK